MLAAVAISAERLLLAPDWDAAIDDVLRQLGLAAEVSRSYLIRVDPAGGGEYLVTQHSEWCAPGVTSQFGNPALNGAGMRSNGFERWIDLMTNQETVHGLVRDFPEQERA